ncbi:MAG TPA: ABC transporter ATP-binding protein [Gemmatimonadales bacterium]|nr:ABC transporter ATP-binding protein [Gemmatimonadales bacterium]
MASVTLRRVVKSYHPPARAVDDVSLEVAPGECVAILGPSGCGKSTLLRCIAGLEQPTSGDILIGDQRVNDVPPAERDVAMVFQSYALYPHLTVRENLEFPLRMRKVRPATRSERITSVARRLELGDLLDRLPGQLSGGQRQRVALGRALVREPAVFLLDEPLSNLDATLRVQLRADLLALQASLEATMLFVTHDQAEALTLGRRLVVIDGGRVQQVGTPNEVYGSPANVFVARFVGTPGMNLFRAGVRLPAGPEGAVQAGIRPEHLALVPVDSGAGNAEVAAVERLGSETLVHVRLPEGGEAIVRVPGLGAFARGDRVGLGFDPANLRWFDATGRGL